MAVDLIGVENVVVIQNKVDIVSEERARESYEEIKDFVSGTVAEDAPVIPVSAQQGTNIDVLIETLEREIPTPDRDPDEPARMDIARSFDVNKPGTGPGDLEGGIIGGSLSQGTFSVGDEVEIQPGREVEEHGRSHWEPITTTITGLVAGGSSYDTVQPGGLIGIGTKLDPAMAKSDGLTGKVAGEPGTLPDILQEFTMDLNLLDHVVGADEEQEVEPVKTQEPLMLITGTARTVGVVTSARGEEADVNLKLPVCAEPGQRVAVSRRIGSRWRLIGYGVIQG